MSQVHFKEATMKKLFAVVVAASLSITALAYEAAGSAAAQESSGPAPMMVSFADLKWTDLPERKGMQFAVRRSRHC
jgi:hypothetical protein